MTGNLIEQPRTHYIDVNGLAQMFGVGRSKARLMMDALPSVRIGSKDYVLGTRLDEYLQEHGGVLIKWPKRKR
jgi:hypothetical protein